MQRLADLLVHLGPHGSFANASQALADEREAADQVDRFLLRFGHPAGRSRTPVEPAPDTIQVA